MSASPFPTPSRRPPFLGAALGRELVYQGLSRANRPIGGGDVERELGVLKARVYDVCSSSG